ncbi:hypothetical protein T265_00586 [Opisthorchis viverrini]|uniref:Uncharacterized protein n=1 Tax=Opisthorchis viverrini TaxID=6198 RepID=A0A075AJJ0_OPIVI|nr:hypothetical protein T265_00586 [Opisthorchis viverrini]KER33469.1 hypothetical protein T265_00586 [Opisthorchis viverrini]
MHDYPETISPIQSALTTPCLRINYISYHRQCGTVYAIPPNHQSVVRTLPPPLDFPCLGLGNLAVSQPSCFFRMAWQLGTERVLQLNNYYYYYCEKREKLGKICLPGGKEEEAPGVHSKDMFHLTAFDLSNGHRLLQLPFLCPVTPSRRTEINRAPILRFLELLMIFMAWRGSCTRFLMPLIGLLHVRALLWTGSIRIYWLPNKEQPGSRSFLGRGPASPSSLLQISGPRIKARFQTELHSKSLSSYLSPFER